MGKKDNPIPPIRRNPRLGREKPTDASVVLGGSKLRHSVPGTTEKPKQVRKKPGRKRKNVKNFVINDVELLVGLSKRLGISLSAVVNLGLRYVQREFP